MNYKLQSVKTGKIFDDEGWTLDAPGEKEPTLIRAVYPEKQLILNDENSGLYKFSSWLPIHQMLEGSSAPLTYKSKGLASYLGLRDLWITFSGWWPEKGAKMKTCSFKETEAYTVGGRMNHDMNKIIVVASAGNTARAFAKVYSDNKIPILLCVPEDNINALWFDKKLNDCVKLICSRSGSDYYDAIHLSEIAAKMENFIPEGGAKNVARRDGMSTTVLSAVTTIGKIPDYYFQSVGSGTGAIAAWEANLRLLEDGRFGKSKMKLMVSQNLPFKPIYDAWKANSKEILPINDELARKQVEKIIAKVLSNRKPPYSITGGLYDALNDSKGDVLIADNKELQFASQLFEKTEDVDIHPAAAVATATLVKAIRANQVEKEACIMLNITGGGEQRFKAEKKMYHLQPSLIFDTNAKRTEVERKILCLFED